MKLTLKITALLLFLTLPFILVLSVGFLLSPEYDETFVGALDEKLERLHSIEENKIVIVGGSSVAFGYDGEIMEKYLDMPVVNFGLYAALGTKLMLDLSKDAVKEGDIVIVAPEMDSETLSLYFSALMTLRALESSPEYLFDIPNEHTASLVGSSWKFAVEKLESKIIGKDVPSGVYRADSFDERGDIKYPRPENVMREYYDANLTLDLTESIVSLDFLNYLNEYIAYCESIGAKVYFEFPPMNRLAFSEDSTEDTRYEFEEFLRDKLDCPLIASSVEDYIYDEGYFYDSNFHLNDAGVIMHTVNVTRDLLLELGIPKAVEENIPEPPSLPEREVRYFGEDENAKYFEFEKRADGSYTLVKVKDEYLYMDSFTVPLGYDGYIVSAIGERAFDGSAIERLTVTEDTNLAVFENGFFLGAESFKELYLYNLDGLSINPPDSFLGRRDDFVVYVTPESNYMDAGGYDWGNRGLTFEYILD